MTLKGIFAVDAHDFGVDIGVPATSLHFATRSFARDLTALLLCFMPSLFTVFPMSVFVRSCFVTGVELSSLRASMTLDSTKLIDNEQH